MSRSRSSGQVGGDAAATLRLCGGMARFRIGGKHRSGNFHAAWRARRLLARPPLYARSRCRSFIKGISSARYETSAAPHVSARFCGNAFTHACEDRSRKSCCQR